MAALEFQINLSGNLSEALNSANNALDNTGKGAKHAAHEFELFEDELGKVRVGALGINFNAIQEGGHFFNFDLAEGAALAFEAIKKVGEAVFDLGKEMIQAAAGAEDLNLAIKLDVGDEGAKQVDELAESFKNSRFSPKMIKESLLPILEESGMGHADQWDDLVTASTDVATRLHKGPAYVATALESFKDIELNPQRLRGSLKALGIKQGAFYKDVGEELGISQKAAEAQVKAGKVDSGLLLNRALHQIAEREGGALGNATNEGNKTLGASLDRLANLKDNLFERLAGSEGMKSVQGFLDNFIQTMEGPIGTDLVEKIGGAFTTLFGDLSGPDGLAQMEIVVGGIATKVGNFVDGFKEAWPEIKADFEAAIPVFEKLFEVLGGIAKVIGALPKIGDELGDKLAQSDADAQTGTVAHQDLGNGAHYSMDEQDRNAALKRGGKGGFFHQLFSSDDTLNQEAFAQIDEEKVPQLASGGIALGPTLALIGEAGPEAVIPLDGRFDPSTTASTPGGGLTVQVGDLVFHFDSAGGAKEDAQQFGQAFRAELGKVIQEAGYVVGVPT